MFCALENNKMQELTQLSTIESHSEDCILCAEDRMILTNTDMFYLLSF